MNKIVITARTLDRIRQAVDKNASKINAPKELLPTYGSSSNLGDPHIEVNAHGMHWVVIERGKEFERKTTKDTQELLYWIFEAVTHTMARDFECKNRIKGQDHRQLLFQKQEEFLGELDSSWKKKCIEEHAEILKQYPYEDNASLRANLYQDLLANGFSAEEAEKIANERYPLPKSNDPHH